MPDVTAPVLTESNVIHFTSTLSVSPTCAIVSRAPRAGVTLAAALSLSGDVPHGWPSRALARVPRGVRLVLDETASPRPSSRIHPRTPLQSPDGAGLRRVDPALHPLP